jgi:O-antigen biosynthesis protein WbqP
MVVRTGAVLIVKRSVDVILALVILCIFSPLMIVLAILVKLTSSGSVIHWSDRIGRGNALFRMPKFRTMHIDTPELATHLLNDPDRYLTSIGKFLRTSSLDELPQLYNIITGDMSFVGPRPALYNQDDLIALRTQKGIHQLVPGITGWAQVNGRDDLSISSKVSYDEYYMKHQSIFFDLKILWQTIFKVVKKDGVHH